MTYMFLTPVNSVLLVLEEAAAALQVIG